MHPLLPTPENAMAAGMGGLLLAQRAPAFQQQLQQRQLPPQLQQQRQQRLLPWAHASPGGSFLVQQPQQLPAFWSGLIPSRGGLVPYPLQVCAASTPAGLDPVHRPLHCYLSLRLSRQQTRHAFDQLYCAAKTAALASMAC